RRTIKLRRLYRIGINRFALPGLSRRNLRAEKCGIPFLSIEVRNSISEGADNPRGRGMVTIGHIARLTRQIESHKAEQFTPELKWQFRVLGERVYGASDPFLFLLAFPHQGKAYLLMSFIGA